jgi:hypothetical protein
MELDTVPGVLNSDIDNHGGENGPRTSALAAGCADSGYSSVMAVLWSLTGGERCSGSEVSEPNLSWRVFIDQAPSSTGPDF